MRHDESESTLDNRKRRSADGGGYGLVIVFVSFLLLFVADGISNSFGVIFVHLQREFKRSRAETSWVGATFVAIPLLFGPLASALTESLSCRVLTVIGGIVGAIGFALSFYAESIAMLCVTIGLVGGLGFSLVFVTSLIIPIRWFDKRLALAMGVASSGTGIGAFVFAPLTQWLLDRFGFRIAMLIFAGISLLMSLAGLFIRMPDAEDNGAEAVQDPTESSTHPTVSPIGANGCASVPEIARRSLDANVLRSSTIGDDFVPKRAAQIILPPPGRRHTSSHLELPSRAALPIRPPPPPKIFQLPLTQRLNDTTSQSCPNLLTIESSDEPSARIIAASYRRPSFSTPKRRFLLVYMSNLAPLTHNRAVLLLILSNLILYAPLEAPLDYLTDHVLVRGLTPSAQQASFLLGLIGLVVTVGQVCFGWLGDYLAGANEALLVYSASVMLAGVATIVLPFLQSYRALLGYSVVFALFKSACAPLFPLILVASVPERSLANGFGVLHLVQGVASLIGPPIGGFMYDSTGSYTLTFVASGALTLFAGLLIAPIPLFRLYRRRHDNRVGSPGESNAQLVAPDDHSSRPLTTSPLNGDGE